MKFLLKIYVSYIRRIIRQRNIMPLIIAAAPRFFSLSESIYIRFKDLEFSCLDILCKNDKISLDIGSLWGGYAIEMRKFSSKVYCFEPNIKNVEFLFATFKNDKKIEIKNLAVSDQSGVLQFRVPIKSPGNATIEPQNRLEGFNDIATYDVKVIAIDDLQMKNIGFVKIDIEGHELSALKGMGKTLMDQKPNLLVEIENRHYDGAIVKVWQYLERIGYDLFFLNDHMIYQITDFKPEKYQNAVNRNTPAYVNNFIGISSSRRPDFIDSMRKKGFYFQGKEN